MPFGSGFQVAYFYKVNVEATWKIENLKIDWPLNSQSPVVKFAVRNRTEATSIRPSLKMNGEPDGNGEAFNG